MVFKLFFSKYRNGTPDPTHPPLHGKCHFIFFGLNLSLRCEKVVLLSGISGSGVSVNPQRRRSHHELWDPQGFREVWGYFFLYRNHKQDGTSNKKLTNIDVGKPYVLSSARMKKNIIVRSVLLLVFG